MKQFKQSECIAFYEDGKARLEATRMSMEDIFSIMTKRNPKEAISLSFDEEGKIVKESYEDFKDDVYYTAGKLSRLLSDTRAGCVVGLKLKNSPRWATMFWALLMSGHSPLLIDAKLPTANANNLLQQAKAQAIVTNDEDDFCVRKLRVGEVRNEEIDYSFQPDWANHVIFCSSGTTGAAKMMVYTGQNLSQQIIASYEMGQLSTTVMNPGKIHNLAMLPFHHIFGFVAVFLWYTYYGKTLVYPRSIATNDLLYACRKGKCTHVYSVPMLWDGVAQAIYRNVAQIGGKTADLFSKMIAYNTGRISKKDAGMASWKFVMRKFQKKLLGTYAYHCISGGGYLSPKTLATINGLGYHLYNGFGMTEVGVTSTELNPDIAQILKGSIGKPLYGVEYKIVGPNAEGEEKTGELYIRSKITHSREIVGGMLKRVSWEDGFFPTGDIVTCDSKGYYYMKGRSKDTIILSNGENVYPDEIEYYFKDVKMVNNVVCLGAKLPGKSEESIVLVVEVDNSVDEKSLKKIRDDIKAINDTLQNEKKVQDVLIDKRPLPMSGSMKVKRFELRKSIEAGSSDFIDFEKPQKQEFSFEGYDEGRVNEVAKRVTKVFSKTLMLPEFKIGPTAIWTTDLGGDSMSYVEMCQALNREFNIEIPEEQYGQLAHVYDFTKFIIDLQDGKVAR
ncbi:MAG: AMP-binding protein [Bacilli bacterium]|nr:AMP-binding protein [Bacilli bacterium]